MTTPAPTRRIASKPRVAKPRRYRLTKRGRVVFGLLGIGVMALIGLAVASVAGAPGVVALTGVEEGELLGATAAERAEMTITFDVAIAAERLEVVLDGAPVRFELSPNGLRALATLPALADGGHELTVGLRRGALVPTERLVRNFGVDATPPGLEILEPTGPVPVGSEVLLRLRVEGASEVAVDGSPVPVGEDGIMAMSFPEVPVAAIEVVATDQAGNQSVRTLSIELALAGSPGGPPIRGVHATGYTWATPELRDPIMALIREGRINTVELDLKDEAGDIWYATEVPLAHEIGAITVLYDLEAVVAELHSLGVRVVGRLVNFRDPRLANHAIETGRLDLVVQSPDGTAFGKYGGFTNPFHPEVWEYNIAIAEEAARLGVDDILYDYVRRPDENIDLMVFPGQEGSPEDAIVDFLAASQPRIHAAGARLGASVFGVAATRPLEIAQDIPKMSEHVDYIAPMLYPSHWGPGEYGVADPNSQPYDIVYRSLLDFKEIMAGTDAELVAWIQDFSLGVEYGETEVRAQIEAAAAAGVADILLWDAATTYTAAALDPQ